MEWTVDQDCYLFNAATRALERNKAPPWAGISQRVGTSPAACKQRWKQLKHFQGLECTGFIGKPAAVRPASSRAGRAHSRAPSVQQLVPRPSLAPSTETASATPLKDAPESDKTKTESDRGGGGGGNAAAASEDIIIHVCDDARNLKKDFTCKRSILTANMKYFQAYLNDNDKYDEIDISVHCDLHIFQWLMAHMTQPKKPKLDVYNLVSILISSEFLQMERLVSTCIEFFKKHVDDVVKSPVDLSCLSEAVLEELASLFTVEEIEKIADRKDKLVGKLYMYKIQAELRDPENVFHQCAVCSKIFTRRQHRWMLCEQAQVFVDTHGKVVARHTPNLAWDLKKYLVSLRVQKLSWRHIYWKLWGLSRSLSCLTCGRQFPVCELNHCAYHTREPIFLRGEATGFHACCDTMVQRFEPLLSSAGCRAKRHVVDPHGTPTNITDSFATTNEDVLHHALAHADVVLAPFVPRLRKAPAASRSRGTGGSGTTAGPESKSSFVGFSVDRSERWATVEPVYGAGGDMQIDYDMLLTPHGKDASSRSRKGKSTGGVESEEDEDEQDSEYSYSTDSRASSRPLSRSSSRRSHRTRSSRSSSSSAGRAYARSATFGKPKRSIVVAGSGAMGLRSSNTRRRSRRVDSGLGGKERKSHTQNDVLRHDDRRRMSSLIDKLTALRASISPKHQGKNKKKKKSKS